MQAYSAEQIQTALAEPAVSGWKLDTGHGEIYKEFKFGDFVEAMSFVNRIAIFAEELAHHPDITINYNRVRLSVVTHDAHGLTELDFKLAARANEIAS